MANNQQWQLQKATLQLQGENQNRNPNNFSSKTTAKKPYQSKKKRAVANKTEFRLKKLNKKKKLAYFDN